VSQILSISNASNNYDPQVSNETAVPVVDLLYNYDEKKLDHSPSISKNIKKLHSIEWPWQGHFEDGNTTDEDMQRGELRNPSCILISSRITQIQISSPIFSLVSIKWHGYQYSRAMAWESAQHLGLGLWKQFTSSPWGGWMLSFWSAGYLMNARCTTQYWPLTPPLHFNIN